MVRQSRPYRRLLGTLVVFAVTACAGAPSFKPREIFDERTGATLSVVNEPLIFARARREVAVNERDYVTLVAAARNVMGDIRLSLIAHRWSTVDVRISTPGDATGRALIIVADGRDIRLAPLKALPAQFSVGSIVLRPPVNDVQSIAFPIDVATLAYIAESRSLSLSFEIAEDPRPYAIWSDGRPALLQFVALPAMSRAKPEM